MNLPNIFDNSNNILFAGIGGGFDIFGAIPLWVELRKRNKNFVFSNYNGKAQKFNDEIYPESYLKKILLENKVDIPVYILPKTGVNAYIEIYKYIIDTHHCDTIVAIDGGIDSLMTGDEENAGTILEDFVSLYALDSFDKIKYLVCTGFGTELEEDISHYHALENLSSLCKSGGFLGSASLIANTEEFDIYRHICEWVWQYGHKSHVHTKIISAVLGEFGDKNLYDGVESNILGASSVKNFSNPFMGIYWFFDLPKVLKTNKLYDSLAVTTTKTDVLMIFRQFLTETKLRKKQNLPW